MSVMILVESDASDDLLNTSNNMLSIVGYPYRNN
jgi:hypothetical protein